MKQENIGICKFCGKEKQLIKSHIIPRKFYLDYKEEKYTLFNSRTGKYTIKQSGSIDKNILCEDCDSKILGEFDKEGYKILLKEIYNHPLYKTENQAMYHLTSEYFNYQLLRKFFISILWRASISELEEYQDIKLGPYENKALSILKDEYPYEHLFKILIFKSPQNNDYDKFMFLSKSRFGYCISYIINMAGYFIVIIVNPKNFDYKLKQMYKDIFLNKNHLFIMESDIIHKKRLKEYSKQMYELWKRGFKPPNIKH